MLRGIIKSPRTRLVAVAVGLGVAGSLATASPSMAVNLPSGLPMAGGNCVGASPSSGKINGRGSTLQLWLQWSTIQDFGADVCGGSVPADSATTSYTVPACGPNEPSGMTDPSDPTNPLDQCTAPGTTPNYLGDAMVAYDYPAAQDASGTGSTQGKNAISCRTDAYSGTDVPYATTDIANMDSAEGAESTITGKPCIPTATGVTYVAPYQTTGNVGGSDPAGDVMSFPTGVSAVGIAVHLPSTCFTSGTAGLGLTSAMVGELFSGTILNWNDAALAGATNLNQSGCNFPVVRVVRNDTSGTTQGFLNYLNDSNPQANPNSPVQQTCSANESGKLTSYWTQLDTNATGDNGYGPENNVWPGNQNTDPAFALGATQDPETNCAYVINSGKSGAQTLMSLLVNGTGSAPTTKDSSGNTYLPSGGIGYADLSDVLHDPGDASNLVIATVTSSGGTAEAPYTGGYKGAAQPAFGVSSNCPFGGGTPTLPSSAVGLTGAPNSGDWALDVNEATAGTPAVVTGVNTFDDISYSKQGAAGYPICSLTWDFVFAGEDGNVTASTKSGVNQVLPETSGDLSVNSLPATANASGTLSVKSNRGQEELVYGSDGSPANTLDNIAGGFGTVAGNTTVFLPSGTGGPEPELNANQRQTLFRYFSYILSDAAQSAAGSQGYAQLPEGWITPLRGAFQANF